MKCSAAWLAEWIPTSLTPAELINSLTMAGIEVSSSAAAPTFTGVVIGTVLSVTKHPQASKLKVCEVSIAQAHNLSIVCGAANVVAGMKVAVATAGALLPQQVSITTTIIRGISSQGMLCAASELGLASKSDLAKLATTTSGIMELPATAPEGMDLWQYLQLDDLIFEAAITPNRSDCLSVYGLAREIAALTGAQLKPLDAPIISSSINEQLPVSIQARQACPRYCGRIIKNIAQCPTPMWLRERLRRSGIRAINLIVDISNYVMLELGQPLHAFDLTTINEQINVRFANPDETIVLLDGRTLKLAASNLVIADAQQPLALAGVMGSSNSGINDNTTAIFLESAVFNPTTIARQRQQQQLTTEASYRFERGVDPAITVLALERASSLLLEIAGGQAGPIINVAAVPLASNKSQPKHEITLRRKFLDSILGELAISDAKISEILQSLGAELNYGNNSWLVKVPSWRFDWQQEIDLVEEVARVYGYDNIPATIPVLALQIPQQPPLQLLLPRLKQLLANLGYHEIITYSFVAAKFQELLNPLVPAPLLINPIASNMNVMRTSLWPGLLSTYLHNRDRQQVGGRFFEAGLCFSQVEQYFEQQLFLAGLISGASVPEQWGTTPRQVDFYDLKADLEQLLQLSCANRNKISFMPCQHPALHPGQAATIFATFAAASTEVVLGTFGVMHPQLMQDLAITEPVLLFSLHVAALLQTQLPAYQEITKFPLIRRDLAIVAATSIPVAAITASIWQYGGKLLQQVQLFDVYCGTGVSPDKRSLAFALTLQHQLRTLQESEVVATIDNIVNGLQQTWGIELRK